MNDTTRPPVLSAADALKAILTAQADVFAKHYAALMTDDAPENPHKARVALRRLRSALDGFAPVLDDQARARLNRRARRLFRILGPLREADVAAEKFAAPRDDGTLGAAADEARAGARRRLERRGAGDFADTVRDALASGDLVSADPRHRRLAAAAVPVLAQFALQKAWTDVHGFGDDLAALSDEDRHEFRKDMKTLRYLSEFFGESWPGKAQDRFLSRMEKLQEALGHLNDIAVHTRGAALKGKLRDSHDVALSEAQEHWRKLSALGPWWFEPTR